MADFPDFEKRVFCTETTRKDSTSREYQAGVAEISFTLQPRHQSVWDACREKTARDGLIGEAANLATLREFICSYISVNGERLSPKEDFEWRAGK